MEINSYLIRFGDCVRNTRKRMKMSQVEFYEYLFPGNNKTEENIKKKMNTIENGKQKSLDLEFILAVCDKCNVSADYILGLNKDYSNHEIELICTYTGLEETAVTQLHKWCKGRNNGADLSKIDEAFIGDAEEQEYLKMWEKREGMQFLKIINYLFKDDDRKVGGRKRSNLTILHSLFMMCMSKPERVCGTLLEEDYMPLSWTNPGLYSSSGSVSIDGRETMMIQDDSKIWYMFSAKEILEQIAKNNLQYELNRLIEQVKNDER